MQTTRTLRLSLVALIAAGISASAVLASSPAPRPTGYTVRRPLSDLSVAALRIERARLDAAASDMLTSARRDLGRRLDRIAYERYRLLDRLMLDCIAVVRELRGRVGTVREHVALSEALDQLREERVQVRETVALLRIAVGAR